MTIPQLKRKLRQLKQTECRIRFRTRPREDHQALVWDAFFSTRTANDDRVAYPLNRLANMDHEEIKQVYEAFLLPRLLPVFQGTRPVHGRRL